MHSVAVDVPSAAGSSKARTMRPKPIKEEADVRPEPTIAMKLPRQEPRERTRFQISDGGTSVSIGSPSFPSP